MAVKNGRAYPLCHNIPIEKIDVRFTLQADGIFIRSRSGLRSQDRHRNGALTAVAVAALTVYDVQAVDATMTIEDIKLREKTKNAVHLLGVCASARKGEPKHARRRRPVSSGSGSGDAMPERPRQVSFLAGEDSIPCGPKAWPWSTRFGKIW